LVAASEGGSAATVRLAHEALISRWQQARDQLASDRRDLETRAIVEREFGRWSQAQGRARRLLLLRNPDLANAVDLAERWGDELDVPTRDFIQRSARRARLAHTLTAAAAVLFALVAGAATVAGILAYREQQEAVAQRNRAEQTLAAATKITNSLVFDVAQRFRDVRGVPAALIKDILDRARALQEQLAKSGQVTPEMKRSEASALDETVDSLLAIGDTVGARAAAEQSQQILADLVAGSPGSTDYQRELSVSYNKVGDVQVAQGDLAGALKSYRDSLAIRERLAQSDAGNAGWQRDLSVSYNFVGNVQLAQGDLAGAFKSYRDDLAIAERLAQSDAGNAGWQRDLSVSYEKVGDVQVAQGDLAGALKSYRDSLPIRERLAQSDAGNAGWQRDLSVSYANLAIVYRRSNDRDNALAALRQGQEILDRLLKLAPDNAVWKRDVAWFDDQIAALTK
jgi:tetratricopeptide (TPR) repeat protein